MPAPAYHPASTPCEERHSADADSEQRHDEGANRSYLSASSHGGCVRSGCVQMLSPHNKCKQLSSPHTRRASSPWSCSSVFVRDQILVIFSVVFFVLSLSTPTLGGRDEYCSTAASGSCPFCAARAPTPDGCKATQDNFYDERKYCLFDTQGLCGQSYTYRMVAQTNTSVIGGNVTFFQDTGNRLIVTFKLLCPFVMRPGATVPINTLAEEGNAVGVFVWNTTRMDYRYQYSDGVAAYSGVFSCLSVVIDLKKVCNPACSQFSNDPFAILHGMCLPDLIGRECPAGDVSRQRALVVQPYFNAYAINRLCGSAGPVLFQLDGGEPGGFVKWDALACGPAGTPLRSPPPSPLSPPPPPTPSLPQNQRDLIFPGEPPPQEPLPPNGRVGREPVWPPNPIPILLPSLPPTPPNPSSPKPSSPLHSPRPPAPPPLKPPPPTPRPPPPRPPPLRSGSPRPPPPFPSPRALLETPPSEPEDGDSGDFSSPPPPSLSPLRHPHPPPSPHGTDDSQGLGPKSGDSPQLMVAPLPPSPAPNQPSPPAHSNSAKSFLTSAGIGVLVGCSAVVMALLCCCCVTVYVFCRRSSRELLSESGDLQDQGDDGQIANHNDADDLSNFSFPNLQKEHEKESTPSSIGAASFSAGMTFGDVERGSESNNPDFSLTSVSGDSRLSLRPPSFQGDLSSSSQPSKVYLQLDQSANPSVSPLPTSKDLLSMHAAQAAAMHEQAKYMAAAGGAGANVASAPFKPAKIAPAKPSRSPSAPQTPPPQAPLPPPPTPSESRATGGRVSSGGIELAKRHGRQLGRSVAKAKISVADCQSVDFVPPATEDEDGNGQGATDSSTLKSGDNEAAAAAAIASVAKLGSDISLAAAAVGGDGGSKHPPAQQPSLFSRMSSALRRGGGANATVATDDSQERVVSSTHRSRSPSPNKPGPPSSPGNKRGLLARIKSEGLLTGVGIALTQRSKQGGSSEVAAPLAAAATAVGVSANGDSHYPSVLAVPPDPNPASLVSTFSSPPGLSSSGSNSGDNPYPPLFSKHHVVVTPATTATTPRIGVPAATPLPLPGRRSQPQLATIPSQGPLVFPESTFATHAPLNLDDDNDGARSSAGSLAPFGSAVTPLSPAQRLSGPVSSSAASSVVTLSSPSLRVLVSSNDSSAAGAAAVAMPAPATGQHPGHCRGVESSSKGGSPGGGGGHEGDVTPRLGSRGYLLSDVSLPMMPAPNITAVTTSTDGAHWQASRVPLPQSPPRLTSSPSMAAAAEAATSAFTFSNGSSGGNGLNAEGGRVSSSPHRAAGVSGGGGGGDGSVSGTGADSKGGSPVRNGASVGSAPGTPPTLPPLPSASSLQPPQLLAIALPEPVSLPAGTASPVKLRSSGSITQVPAPPPPPPLHLQPLDGPYGSLVRPPQPLALQTRNSLPAPSHSSSAITGGAASLPWLGNRSSSPTPASPLMGPVSGQPHGSGLSSPLTRSPSTSPLRHASSAALPLPLATAGSGGVALPLSLHPTGSVSNRLSCPSSPPADALGNGTGSAGGSVSAGGSLTSRIQSAGSLTAIGVHNSFGKSSSASSWGSAVPQFLDLDSIRRYCSRSSSGADGGQLAEMCGCGPTGEEVPLGGAGSDGLNAVYNALCKLEPGAVFCSKYKIRETPVLGRHSVVLLAKNVYNKARVAIKFHANRRQYERERDMLMSLSSMHVPALHEPLDGPQLAALGLPAALVMEAGRWTLTEWLRGDGGGAPRDLLSLKAALHQILAALVHLHSRRIVHRDIKPANIMWFEDSHRFKLIDLAEAAIVGEAALPCCTPLYSAPEQIKSALEGSPSPAAVTPAADMWSFGIVAYEVLSGGSRFYGPSPSLQEVLETVFGHRLLPNEGENALAGFELAQARRLISHLVIRSPAQRWSAATCHRNALFASGDDTDQRAAKWDSVFNRISEVHQTVTITSAEMRTAQMAINFTICEATPSSPGGSPRLDRAMSTASTSSAGPSSGPPRLQHMDSCRISRRVAYKEVPMMSDDHLPGEPIFMLLLRKQYQIRITVAHARGLKLDICNIEHLKLTTPDNQVQVLPVRLETGLRDGGVEYVADWDPQSSQSKHLLVVTESEGPIQRRVVFLNAELVVQLSGLPQPMTVNAMLYVVIEKQSFRYNVAKLKLWTADRWSQAPQWMRDVAKGTLVLVRVAGNVVGV